jgi:hypothetical protein
MPGLDPGIHHTSGNGLVFDGLPGHPRSSRGQAPGNDEIENNPRMRHKSAPFLLALALAALALSACVQRSQVPVLSSLNQDDDTFCRANNVVAGSPEYVACRKDRDVARGNAIARADKKQRDLGEYMLNNPVRP